MQGRILTAKETIIVGDDVFKIETRLITLIFKDSHVQDVTYPERLPIDSEMTVQHGKQLTHIRPIVEHLFLMVFNKFNKPVTVEAIKELDSKAFYHVLGLLDLSVQCLEADVPFAWVYPETFLQPAQQAELGDVVIFFSKCTGVNGNGN